MKCIRFFEKLRYIICGGRKEYEIEITKNDIENIKQKGYIKGVLKPVDCHDNNRLCFCELNNQNTEYNYDHYILGEIFAKIELKSDRKYILKGFFSRNFYVIFSY